MILISTRTERNLFDTGALCRTNLLHLVSQERSAANFQGQLAGETGIKSGAEGATARETLRQKDRISEISEEWRTPSARRRNNTLRRQGQSGQ